MRLRSISSLLLVSSTFGLTACVVTGPPRVYVQPAYVAPAPRVYYAPAPEPYVVVTPAPRGYYYEGGRRHHHHGHRDWR